MSCPWKDIFGAPRTGAHAWRLGDVAVVDTALTFVLAFALQKIFFKNFSFLKILVVTFIVGEILHWAFCVDTKVIQMLNSVLSSSKSL